MSDTAASSVGSEELAQGLMLVRASTLKMIRLQLAMERHDRRVALETVDDLVALDRRLQDYLADVPNAPDSQDLLIEMAAERDALDQEKLTLAAGVIRREPLEGLDLAAPSIDGATEVAAHGAAKEETSGRSAAWLGAVLMLVSAIAVAVALVAAGGAVRSLLLGAMR